MRGKTTKRQENISKTNISPEKKGFFKDWGRLLCWVLFPALAFILYAHILHGPFVFDDIGHIPENSHIQMNEFSLEKLWEAATQSRTKTRPVSYISFALNYLFGGNNPFGYHVVNVGIHVITALVLYFLLRATFALPAASQDKKPDNLVPFFAALIWLVHPNATQSVSYIVQRMNSMSAMFYVAALLLYIKARTSENQNLSRILFVCCAALFFLSIGSKEIAVTFPVVVILYEWFFFQDMSWSWVRRRVYWFAGVIAACVVLVLLYTDFHPVKWILDFYIDEDRNFSIGERLLTQLRVTVFYISLLFWALPTRMNLDHDFLVSTGFLSPPGTLACAFLIASLLGWAVLRARKERLLSFCILWFFGNLVIESTVVALELVFEHRLYLPSMFVSVFFVYFIWRIVKNREAAIGILCVIAVLLCVATYQRNHVWASEIALMKDCAEKSPAKARPNSGYAKALVRVGRKGEAVAFYQKALEIDPKCAKTHNNLGSLLAKLGMFEKGIKHINISIKLNPKNPKAYLNAGQAYLSVNRPNDAVSSLKKALELNPEYAKAHNNLALAYDRLGKTKNALRHMITAAKLEPCDPVNRFNLGKMLDRLGKTKEALEQYRIALKLAPNLIVAKNAINDIQKQTQGRRSGF